MIESHRAAPNVLIFVGTNYNINWPISKVLREAVRVFWTTFQRAQDVMGSTRKFRDNIFTAAIFEGI